MLGVANVLQHAIVMLTPVKNDDDRALLAPLWEEENKAEKAMIVEAMKRALRFDEEHIKQLKQFDAKVKRSRSTGSDKPWSQLMRMRQSDES